MQPLQNAKPGVVSDPATKERERGGQRESATGLLEKAWVSIEKGSASVEVS